MGEMRGGVNTGMYSLRLNQNQTVTYGDMLIVSSGYVQIALHSSTLLLGVAAEALANGAGEYEWLNFYPALEGTIFAGQCSGTPTQSDLLTVGASAKDIEGTTGIMEINEDASASDVISLLGPLDRQQGLGLNAVLEFIVLLRQFE